MVWIDNRFKMAALVICAGIFGFFLGGLAVYHALHWQQEEPIVLRTLPTITSPAGERVFASVRGSRFYPWWCEAGSTIAENNRIWFTTPQEAQSAGYTIAKACAL